MTDTLITTLHPSVKLDARTYRQRQLLDHVGQPMDICAPQTREVVNRILGDMEMDVAAQARLWGPLCHKVLQKPIPYDTANALKPAIMLELMKSTGDSLAPDVWAAMQATFVAAPHATPIVLALGTSGMGKTKCAYDIGLEHAFVVTTRLVEHSILTSPWQTFMNLAREIVRTAVTDDANRLPPQSERESIKLAMVVLMAAHLEWVVAVSEEAAQHPHFTKPDPSRTQLARMREVVLRAQRNAFTYQYVTYYFQRAMQNIIAAGISVDGAVAFDARLVENYYKDMINRAHACWKFDDVAEPPRIVFAYDEVQALLDDNGIPDNICVGVFHAVSSTPETPKHGLLYGLLAVMRHMQGVECTGHLMLGNHSDLPAHLSDRHSPAHGVSKTVDKVVSLDVAAIRSYMALHLTPEAAECLSDDQLREFTGRPLFASRVWARLLTNLRGSLETEPLGPLMEKVFRLTLNDVATEARTRVRALWKRHEPRATHDAGATGATFVPSQLPIRLFHDLIMSSGQSERLSDMQAALKEAIHRGILNARGSDVNVALDAEPVTKAAIEDVGMDLLRRGEDGVMAYLAATITGPAGGEVEDQGIDLRDCYAWALVRRCLLAPTPLSLAELFRTDLARYRTMQTLRGDVDIRLLPAVCSRLHVHVKRGIRYDAAQFETTCPLGLLEGTHDVLVHRFTRSMAGPDIIIPAVDSETNERRIVLLQLTNHRDCTLEYALQRLDMSSWYPDSEGREHAAYQSVRDQLARNPTWAQPIRVVVTTRPPHPSLLHAVTYYNLTQLRNTPILLVQPTAASLGVPIIVKTDTQMTMPQAGPISLWPCRKLRGQTTDFPG